MLVVPVTVHALEQKQLDVLDGPLVASIFSCLLGLQEADGEAAPGAAVEMAELESAPQPALRMVCVCVCNSVQACVCLRTCVHMCAQV